VILCALKDLLRNSLLLFALLLTGSAFSQVPDTVVVYEYVYVTDTVWIERETIDFKKLISVEPAAFQVNNSLSTDFYPSTSATISDKSIYEVKNQKQDEMKKLAFLGLALFALNTSTKAQSEFKDNLSIFLKGNLATQLASFPDISNYNGSASSFTEKEFGEHLQLYLPSVGFGVSSEIQLTHFLSFIPRACYIQKGCSKQVSGGKYYVKVPGEYNTYTNVYTNDNEIQNRFHTISTDILLKLAKKNYKKIQPMFYTGLSFDLLLWYKNEFEIDMLYGPDNEYNNFKRLTYGLVNGIGLEANNNWYMQFEMNNDLSFLVKNKTLKIRNLVFSVNLGIYLNKIPHFKIVNTSKKAM